MKPDITVIVPIYNTEKYLDKCLLSIRSQTFKNIEVICVDDCSPDNSYLIVEKHCSEDTRIKYIRHEKNKGQGGARNTGILAASADYITGVDSDDSINAMMLEQLWEATDNGRIDVVSCNYNYVDEAGNTINSEIYRPKEVLNNNNAIDIFSLTCPAFWNKLWRKSLFTDNNIFFPENIYFEDMVLTPLILTKVKSFKFIESCLYDYLQRGDSTTSTFTARHLLDHFKAFEIILSYLNDNLLTNRYKQEFIDYIDKSIRYHVKCVISSTMSDNEIDQYLRLLLMNKVSFLENYKSLLLKERSALLYLLGSAHTGNDIRVTKIIFRIKKRGRKLLSFFKTIQ